MSAGNGLSAVFSFLRNIAIARMVSVADFGIVVLLSMAVAVIETISNLAVDRLLVQAPDGDDPRLQAAAHALQVVRGLVGGLVMLLSASLLASLFRAPEAAWAFKVLALTPVIRAFAHLDINRMQREMRFQPTFWVVALPSGLSLAISLPLAYWLHDYSVIVWATLVQLLAQTAVSHLVADRPYRWSWERQLINRIMAFGWPLLVNGLLMFVIFQGDKAIVAAAFTPEVVGWYGAAFMLSMTPAMLITSVIQSLLLPMLARTQGAPAEFARRSEQAIQICLATGLFVAIAFSMLGPELLMIFFGSRYMAGAEIVILLGLAQGIRIAKAGQFISSVALARTRDPLVANFARGAAFLCATSLVAIGFGPLAVAVAGIVGEFLSYLISVYLLAKRQGDVPKRPVMRPAVFFALLALSYGVSELLRMMLYSYAYYAAASLWLLSSLGTFLAVSPDVRRILMRTIRGSRENRPSSEKDGL